MVDSKELEKEVLEIHFEEKEGDVLAYLGSELMATLNTVRILSIMKKTTHNSH